MREDISCAVVSVGADCESDEYDDCEHGKYERHSGEVEGGEGANDRYGNEQEIGVETDIVGEPLDDDCSDKTSSSMASIA